MVIIPIKAVPSQYVTVTLSNQICQISLYQKAYGLFMDLRVSNQLIVAGVICQNLNLIVRSIYLGFLGDLMFIDNQGSDDPTYTGLGTRFSLAYLSPSDLQSA